MLLTIVLFLILLLTIFSCIYCITSWFFVFVLLLLFEIDIKCELCSLLCAVSWHDCSGSSSNQINNPVNILSWLWDPCCRCLLTVWLLFYSSLLYLYLFVHRFPGNNCKHNGNGGLAFKCHRHLNPATRSIDQWSAKCRRSEARLRSPLSVSGSGWQRYWRLYAVFSMIPNILISYLPVFVCLVGVIGLHELL